jgi:hypothetical protein
VWDGDAGGGQGNILWGEIENYNIKRRILVHFKKAE